MRLFGAILFFAAGLVLFGLGGCAKSEVRGQRSEVRAASSDLIPIDAFSAAQPAVVIPQKTYTVRWTPGDFTNFVVVCSPDLMTWQTLTNLGNRTNFTFVADKPAQFYRVYGTNKGCVEFAWAGGNAFIYE